MVKLIATVIFLFGGMFTYLFMRGSARKDVEREAKAKAYDKAIEVKKELDAHRDDDMDSIRERLSKYSRD